MATVVNTQDTMTNRCKLAAFVRIICMWKQHSIQRTKITES